MKTLKTVGIIVIILSCYLGVSALYDVLCGDETYDVQTEFICEDVVAIKIDDFYIGDPDVYRTINQYKETICIELIVENLSDTDIFVYDARQILVWDSETHKEYKLKDIPEPVAIRPGKWIETTLTFYVKKGITDHLIYKLNDQTIVEIRYR